VVVLHPDELHDGQAGTDSGFSYQSIYIPPAKIQDVLGGRALPFVNTGVSSSPCLPSILKALLAELESPLDQDEHDDTIFDLAMELEFLSGNCPKAQRRNYEAVMMAKNFIEDNLDAGFTLTELEKETDQSRWQLSRDFRLLLGTSPYRYLVMRRLDRARKLLLDGVSIADAAHTCIFSDQSHFNRHFRKTYGMTPKTWLSSIRNAS